MPSTDLRACRHNLPHPTASRAFLQHLPPTPNCKITLKCLTQSRLEPAPNHSEHLLSDAQSQTSHRSTDVTSANFSTTIGSCLIADENLAVPPPSSPGAPSLDRCLSSTSQPNRSEWAGRNTLSSAGCIIPQNLLEAAGFSVQQHCSQVPRDSGSCQQRVFRIFEHSVKSKVLSCPWRLQPDSNKE